MVDFYSLPNDDNGNTSPASQRQRYLRRISTGISGGQRSGQMLRDPMTGQMYDPGGIYQGGQSVRRAGLPEGGIVGSPNVGLASELMRLQRQGVNLPAGYQPEISSMRTSFNSSSLFNNPTYRKQAGLDEPIGTLAPWANQQSNIGQPNFGVTQSNYEREQSPFEKLLESGYSGMLNPQGEQSLRTRISDIAAGQQRMSEERLREDAIRRGASGAQGDADIRDQLTRIQSEGARNQQQGQIDADQYFNNLRLSALGGGAGLLGSQLGDTRSLREMITMLEALKSQTQPSGLQFVLGQR